MTKKILIIQLRRIGDVIVTTPVVRALKEFWPDSVIHFLVEKAPAPVLAHLPGLDRVIVFDKSFFWATVKELRREKYDMVLDFMNNPRSAQLTFLSGAPVRAGFKVPFWDWVSTVVLPKSAVPLYGVENKLNLLRHLGIPAKEGFLPEVHLRPSEKALADQWWQEKKLTTASHVIGVVPIHRHAIRQWPTSSFKQSLEILLEKKDRRAVIFAGPGEEERASSLVKAFPQQAVLIPPGTIRECAALLDKCDVVMTNDGGSMHLSVAVGTPTVTIYGPTLPEAWNPRREPHHYAQAQGLACVGCHKSQCPYQHECMAWVSPDEVAQKVEKILLGQKVAV